MERAIGKRARLGNSYRAGTIMIAVTLAACVVAVVFRTPLRSRYWAWQVVRARGMAQRAAPLTHLCNAGDAGRWGTETLLTHPDAEIRQYGVVVLQHVRSDWSRRRLLQMLPDPSEAVGELAALGLAIHGDASIIPELERLYATGDSLRASVACIALERLATPEAIVALAALAGQPADAARRAALVDALAGIGTADCAAPLLELLSDDRPCDVLTRAERVLERFTPLAAERGLIDAPCVEPASQPTVESASQTVAERAAAALARITGLNPPFASDLSEEQREAAQRIWREWAAAQRGKPSSTLPALPTAPEEMPCDGQRGSLPSP